MPRYSHSGPPSPQAGPMPPPQAGPMPPPQAGPMPPPNYGGGDARTADFQDYNNNGIDDRDEGGQGGQRLTPEQRQAYNQSQQGGQGGQQAPMPPNSDQSGLGQYSPYRNYTPGQHGGEGMGKWGNPNKWQPKASNSYGGQRIAGADPSMGDYDSVQQYSDQAHDAARRYLDPQQDVQIKRFNQELINRGVDPNSEAGRNELAKFQRGQNDANNSAAFGALGFGQGIQNQMWTQENQDAQLAGSMQQALWENQLGGKQLGMQGYIADQNYATAQNSLDFMRQGAQFDQWANNRNFDYDVWQGNQTNNILRDALSQAGLNNTPIPAPPQASYGPVQGSDTISEEEKY